MAGSGSDPETGSPRRPFHLPSSLDMGTLKLDDLEFDIDQEVARLRATHATDAIPPAPSGMR